MIKLVVFDFDGVFTDGSIIFDNENNIIKQYNVKYGVGIKLLKSKGIEVGCISGYKVNQSQKNIMGHLNIDYISMGSNNKSSILKSWIKELNITLEEVGFMGDDINDIEIMKLVKLVGCPKDAHKNCLELAHFVSEKGGGKGCIREFCDYILNEDISPTIFDEIKDEFNYQINNYNLDDIYKLRDMIYNIAGNVYFLGIGKSGTMAKHCSDLLKSISIVSIYLEYTDLLHGNLGAISNNDIVILFSNSGNTIELVSIIHFIKSKAQIWHPNCSPPPIIGICSNDKSKFVELCDETFIIPFKNELSGEIDKIPTNSCMSQLIFSNLLVSILKKDIDIEEYKKNHPSGDIGKDLLKIKDIMVTEYPKLLLEDNLELSKILLEMTKYKIGCCFFVDNDDKLMGILTDGDIRRLLINNKNINYISIENINCNYYYETDLDKFVNDCNKGIYFPIIRDNKLIGLVININS